MLPTLLQKGKIVPPKGITRTEKRKLDNMIAIKYIMDFIDKRIPKHKYEDPVIKPQSIGDKVILLRAETGSGKSTNVAPAIYQRFSKRMRGNIAITQPRVLTAIDIPHDIINIPQYAPFLKLDKNIGYQTGQVTRKPHEKGIIFMTTEILTQQILVMDPLHFLNRYSFTILDEIHERSKGMDMLLFLLKRLLADHWQDSSCPIVIIMSATFDPTVFMNYLNVPQKNFIEVIGQTFPVQSFYPRYEIQNYINYTVNKVRNIHLKNLSDIKENNPIRDIIIFAYAPSDIYKIVDQLHLLNSTLLDRSVKEIIREEYGPEEGEDIKGGGRKEPGEAKEEKFYLAPIILTSETFRRGEKEYKNLFSPIEQISVPFWATDKKGKIDTRSPPTKWVIPSRRVIVATPVAETGVTIETLKYCIDTGWVFNVELNPYFACNLTAKKNITKFMALQRKGRVARVAPGFWYPCYTQETYELLPEENLPDILTKDITYTLLDILIRETETTLEEEKKADNPEFQEEKDTGKLFQIHPITDKGAWYRLVSNRPTNISAFDFLESPSANSLVYSIEKLFVLGMIDFEYKPTLFGYLATKIRKIDIEHRRMLFAGYTHGANILDLITMVAFLFVGKRNVCKRECIAQNPLKLKNEKEALFYHQIVFADEFIEFVFLWNDFSEELNKINQKIIKSLEEKEVKRFGRSEEEKEESDEKEQNPINGGKEISPLDEIQGWCEVNHVNYYYLLQVISIRDEIIENMLEAGLNPYYNGMMLGRGTYNLNDILRKNLDNGIEEIRKIKECILDGYRFNLAIWDDTSKKYTLIYRNLPINVESSLLSKFSDEGRPQKIIIAKYSLSESRSGKKIFEFNSQDVISVLDGFINVDINFLFY
jgi:HrpA-like RNA helicase